MSARRSEGQGSRALSWAVSGVLLGWAVVYNLMRVGGSSPREAAWVSLAIGGAGGLAAAGAGVLAARRMAASGRVLRRPPAEVPPPERLSRDQRDATRLASGVLAALAAASILLALALGAAYAGAEAVDRSATTLLLVGWNLVAGLWFGDEALRLARGDAEGAESVTLGCMITAIFAGVGLSRSLVEPGQMVLIVLAGAAGGACALVTWRLTGARGVPTGAVVAVAVAVASFALPLIA